MALPSLLNLDLRESLAYRRLEGPAPGSEGFRPELPGLEGEERLYLFGETLLVWGPEGPRCSPTLPLPLVLGTRGGAGHEEAGNDPLLLEAGAWLFMQWRPGSPTELAQGIEWFAREAWWERRSVEGPPHLRLVREDGRVAYQLLWRLAGGPA